MTGDELAKDLAELLWSQQWMVWLRMPLGSVFLGGGPGRGTAIVDLLAIAKSYTQPRATIYEVKVARGDFFRDTYNLKYERYLEHCNRLFFAAPAGLLKPEEVPPECGLIVRGEKGWHVRKTAPSRHWEPSAEFLLALLFRGYKDFRGNRDLQDRERWERNESLGDAARRHGIRIATEIAHADELLRQADVLAEKIGCQVGKSYGPGKFWDAQMDLRRMIEVQLNQHRSLPQALRLAKLAMELFDGRFLARWELADIGRVIEELGAIRAEFEEKEAP